MLVVFVSLMLSPLNCEGADDDNLAHGSKRKCASFKLFFFLQHSTECNGKRKANNLIDDQFYEIISFLFITTGFVTKLNFVKLAYTLDKKACPCKGNSYIDGKGG